MAHIRPCEVPLTSLLRVYKDGPGFADCYVTEVRATVTQAMFIEAFYTSTLFKVERMLLQYLASKPASDRDAQHLAAGEVGAFSAWRVEQQSAHELLLADMTGRTRSWLMASPAQSASHPAGTLLYFGSAVVARPGAHGAKPSMGWQFDLLLGFHRLYSRLLLRAASRNLRDR